MNDKKKAAIKRWIPIILEANKGISVNELTYQLGNVVGLIDRDTVLDCLREMKGGKE
ncbi:hypothetical protein QUA41_31075 [Microcoleus sp. Pol11C1]|uniref:hypothetical protein n=1 Tax=unclassified Microcoleus TaxID=2642155 RepID=UPI002FD05A5D